MTTKPKKLLKIAIFTDTFTPDVNGVAHSIDRFCKLLADDGHKIMIFCPKHGRYKDEPYKNITVKRFSSVTFPTYKEMKIAIPYVMRIVNELREFQPDVVHIQTPLGIGWVAIWAVKILKLKNVQTYHSHIPDFMIYLTPASFLGIRKVVNLVKSSELIKNLMEEDITNGKENGKLRAYLKLKLEDAVKKTREDKRKTMTERFAWEFTRVCYNRGDLVLTPSEVLKNSLVKHEVKAKVDVLSNGIDYDQFKKKEDYQIHNKLFYAGRLGYEKHVEIAINAVKIALKTNPNITLDIVGDGPARKHLERLVKKHNLSKSVRFLGYLDRKKLFPMYAEYDAFITASTMETQGIVLLEAMAAGLPVIAARELAVPEIVLHNKNGYLSKPYDAKEMAQNILKLFADQERFERFGHESLKVAQSHEITKCKERLENFYVSLT